MNTDNSWKKSAQDYIRIFNGLIAKGDSMFTINKKRFKEHFRRKMNNLYAQSIEEASNEELFNVLCCVVRYDLKRLGWN